MTLVIPMSGQGKRFVAAGYTALKPLIKVDGRYMIDHVLDMYPGEKDIIFICNEAHKDTTPLKEVLLTLRPQAKIVWVLTEGLGPIEAIQKAYSDIPDDEEIMVSYCDFTGIWDYEGFKKKVHEMNVDGAIPSYKGFHPHLLGSTFYGHMRWDQDNLMLEIKEKESFTDNKMNEYSAAGSYWFKRGKIMKQYLDEAVRLNMKTGHEFFCSLPYNLMVRDGLKVWIPEMRYFCQWGTPEDLEEYESWSRVFAQLSGKPTEKGITEIPPSREANVKARTVSEQEFLKTSAYWLSFFSLVPWHPYKKSMEQKS